MRHWLCLAGLAVGLAAADIEERDALSDVTIEGAVAIPAMAILKELRTTVSCVELLRAETPAADLRQRIAGLVQDGYRHAGFDQAAVHAGNRPDGWTLAIREGVRRKFAGWKVVGGRNADEEAFVGKVLTSCLNKEDGLPAVAPPPGAPVNDPLLVMGRHAVFCRDCPDDMAQALVKAFDADGRRPVTASITVEPRGQDGAEVVVTLVEGKRGTITEVAVTGCTINRPEEVCAWLERETGLKSGVPASKGLMRRVRERLVASGRFVEVQTRLVPIEGKSDLSRALVELLDHGELAPLSTPWNEREQRLEAARRELLERLSPGGAGMVITITIPDAGTVDLGIRPGKALGLRVNLRRPVMDLHATITDARLVLIPAPMAPRMTFAMEGNRTLQVEIGLLTQKPKQPEDGFGRANATLMLSTHSQPETPTIRLVLTAVPAFFFRLMHDRQTTEEIIADRFLIRLQGKKATSTLILDHTRNLLLEMESREQDRAPIVIRFDRDPQRLDALVLKPEADARLLSLAQVMDQGWGLFEFLLPAEDEPRRIMRVLRALSSTMITTLEQQSAGQVDAAGFLIHEPLSHPTSPAAIFGHLVRAGAAFMYDRWSSRAWPSLVAYQVAAVLEGDSRQAGETLQRLAQPGRMGPLGHLAVAGLLRLIRHPAGLAFAHRGGQVCTARETWTDLLRLTGGVDWVFRLLKDFPAVAEVTELFPPERRAAVAEKLKAFQAAPDDPRECERRCHALFTELWDLGLGEMLRKVLDQASNPPGEAK